MVGLEAMVLGRLGRKPSPHPRACALSCPSSAIYGPGSLGRFTRPFALHPLCVAQERLWCEYDYLRWGAHHTKYSYNSPMLGAPASTIGSELPPLPRYGAPDLHFPRVRVPNLERLALSGWSEASIKGHMADRRLVIWQMHRPWARRTVAPEVWRGHSLYPTEGVRDRYRPSARARVACRNLAARVSPQIANNGARTPG